uniref:Uncharacterized protein n=1 Tax=Vitis vinifera TaxID=29760 RepID=A5AKS2_VITVI|nr:hypothetical protein VITISV_039519 [Vitis vinifera]
MSYCKDPRDNKYKRTTRIYYQFSPEIPQHPVHFAFGAYPVELNEVSSQFLIKTSGDRMNKKLSMHVVSMGHGEHGTGMHGERNKQPKYLQRPAQRAPTSSPGTSLHSARPSLIRSSQLALTASRFSQNHLYRCQPLIAPPSPLFDSLAASQNVTRGFPQMVTPGQKQAAE